MNREREIGCVIIGHNGTPFAEYERRLRTFGDDSELYRDLRLSFVNLLGRKSPYIDLLNHVVRLSGPTNGRREEANFKSGDIPNLAAVYLSGFPRNKGDKVEYINLFQHEREKLIEYLAADPLCVAITTTLYLMNLPVKEIVPRERFAQLSPFL